MSLPFPDPQLVLLGLFELCVFGLRGVSGLLNGAFTYMPSSLVYKWGSLLGV